MTTLLIIGGFMLALIITLLVLMFTIKFDETHTANRESWHLKLFNILRFSDDYDRPKTICQYFWLYIQYIISLPFTLPIVLFGAIFYKLRDAVMSVYLLSMLFWGVILFSFAIGGIIFDKGDAGWSLSPWLATLIGFGITALILVTLIGIILFIGWLQDILHDYKYRNYDITKAQQKSMLTSRFKAWKEKNCPVINWK